MLKRASCTPDGEAPDEKVPRHRFSAPWNNSDVIFVVEKDEFHCHYRVLKANSPVFAAMFGVNFLEGKERKVDLPEKRKDAFLYFLNLLYPLTDSFEPEKSDLLPTVLTYIDEYQTSSARKQVDMIYAANVYPTSIRNISSVIDDLVLAETFGLKKTIDVCLQVLCSKTGWSKCVNPKYEELSADSKLRILQGQLTRLIQGSKLVYTDKHCTKRNVTFDSEDKTWDLIKQLSGLQRNSPSY